MKPEIIPIPNSLFGPGSSGKRFNAGLLRRPAGWLLAYREGTYPARIGLAELSPQWEVRNNWLLDLNYRSVLSFEDPRLITWDRKTMIACSGYEDVCVKPAVCHQMLGELVAGQVRNLQPLRFPWKQHEEKNWQLFAKGDRLFAVYSICPHRIVEILGRQATPVCQTHWSARINEHHLRGGAPPVLHDGRYYSFCHSMSRVGRRRLYRLYLYTFDVFAPFAPRHVCRAPLFEPRLQDVQRGNGWNVIFPVGAAFHDSCWWITCGYQDCWTIVLKFKAGDIERSLVKI